MFKTIKTGIPIFIVAVNMRAGLILIGPLLPILQREYGISVFTESILAAAPLLCFSLTALFMGRIINLADTNRIIAVAVSLLTASLFLRTTFGIVSILLFSITLGIAVAVLNFMLPVWVRENHSGNAGLLTGTYAAIMASFAAVALAITVPLSELTSLSWRLSMAPWLAVGIVSTIWWWLKIPRSSIKIAPQPVPNFWKSPLLRNKKAWSLTLFFGILNMIHYASATWLPTALVSKGMPLVETGYLVAVSTIVAALLSLFVPHFASRGKDFRAILVTFSILIGLAYLAIASDTGPRLWLWVILYNLGLYVTFSLSLYLVVFKASNDEDTKTLSIMVQCIGYFMATTSPIILGLLFTLTDSWQSALLFPVGLAVIQIFIGLKAGSSEKI
jgi:CP family cyanate transporter-like MFS transporter